MYLDLIFINNFWSNVERNPEEFTTKSDINSHKRTLWIVRVVSKDRFMIWLLHVQAGFGIGTCHWEDIGKVF